jgi:uncharacterized protein YbaR (Trm112 family)
MMRIELMDILACPVCKTHPLILRVDEQEGDDVRKGGLTCSRCQVVYPIEDSIPNLLPKKK